MNNEKPDEASFKILHATIKKISEDVERFSFNTSVSQFMICVNELRKIDEHSTEILDPLARCLAPFAPFIAEELWAATGHNTSVHLASFPEYDEKWLVSTSVNYPVCINGKKRGEINLPVGSSNEEIEKSAMALPDVLKWLDGKPIRKVIIVPDKMINIVI